MQALREVPRRAPRTGPATVAAFVVMVLVGAYIGGYGPVSRTWQINADNQRGAAVLAVFCLVWSTLLVLRLHLRWAGRVAFLATAGLALAITPTIGGQSVLVALVGVVLANGVIQAWEPLGEREPRRHRIAWLAGVPLVLAEVRWKDHADLLLVLVAMAATVAVLELYQRRPDWLARAHAPARWLVTCPPAVALVDQFHRVRRALSRTWAATSWRQRPLDRRDRSFVAAAATAFLIRLAWVSTMTRDSGGESQLIGDWYSTWNVRIATQFAHGHTPYLNGRPTAFWPPGYGALLAPLSWISNHTGWFSIGFAAALLNVVLATASVVLAGAVAAQWFGRSARNPAAWLLALAPSHVFATSAAVPETLITTILLFTLWALATVFRTVDPDRRRAPMLAIGLLVGFAMLTNDRATVLLTMPLAIAWVSERSLRSGLRATAMILLGALVLLGGWAVRNGLEVGWWSPTATSVPEGMCTTKYGFDATTLTATNTDRLLQLANDCIRDGPLDDRRTADQVAPYLPPSFTFGTPDEAAYARRNLRGSLRWFASHPGDLIARMPTRANQVAGGDRTGGLDLATHFGREQLVSGSTISKLNDLADAWYRTVLALAVAAVLLIRRVRTSWPMWLMPVLLFLPTMLAPYGNSRHYFAAHPFLAILAAAALGAISRAERLPLEPAPELLPQAAFHDPA